jgi:hypothetical protein
VQYRAISATSEIDRRRAFAPMPSRRAWLARGGLIGLAAVLPAAPAAAIEPPAGPVVLTLTGEVLHRNAGEGAAFDMAMLEHLPQLSFGAETPWYARRRQFTGPLLREVLRAAGARGATLRVRSLNDYRVDIPFGDAQRFDVVVARLLDGAPMRVRDRGPLFVIYPFDAVPALRNAVYYSRCAWQLRAIEVL